VIAMVSEIFLLMINPSFIQGPRETSSEDYCIERSFEGKEKSRNVGRRYSL